MADRPKLSAADLAAIRKALRCPAKLIKSDVEKEFLAKTKERLAQFGENIYLSEKQLGWLRKIEARIAAEGAPAKEEKSATAGEDLPDYDELAGKE